MSCTCIPAAIDGIPYNQIIGTVFGDCVRSKYEYVSFSLGIVGLIAYFFSMMPQMIENYQNQSAAGLSISFIMCWLLGDSAGLAGTFLTNQLPIQKLTGAYFVLSDAVILGQILYYGHRNRAMSSADDEIIQQGEEDPLLDTSPRSNSSSSSLTSYTSSSSTTSLSSSSASSSSTKSTRHLITIAAICMVACCLIVPAQAASLIDEPQRLCNEPFPVSNIGQAAGSLLAWASGLLYLFSRIPQVIKNYREGVEGLSPMLFLITTIGNVAYGLQITMRFPPVNQRFFAAVLPYLMGSFGVLFFDLVILAQTYLHGKRMVVV
ncbi:hypothetical protein SmJEL517_g00495 [Synchytrium microbalum]|uniref:Uncharacterized protein n=1 Tax=Synchytrium microbalum TaxID=1806994 RepID=A0A507CHL3_9FUNG|nr:uncharacterized protein SmJEL517_g00495 [Synchytrium microbalum]TPX37534.1 hypothetical protein SmJEL517_g00495 [Synchytrium microbalum]